MRGKEGERGNRPPKFGSIDRSRPMQTKDTALSLANPTGDRENCVQSCHAWLMRLRGYNVSALPGLYDPPGVVGSTAVFSTKLWRNDRGEIPQWSEKKNTSAESVLTDLAKTKVGDYGLVRFRGFPSHVMGWQHRDQGVVLVDPQMGCESDEAFRFGLNGSFQWVTMTNFKPTARITTLFQEGGSYD
ncbi:hypothetical protein CAQUA_03515 [Corynebacterium aquatimens]|uniref:Tox-PL domain-containing protein n=1 Tax=Corynebacterium aquatimens TaxID=1190508 RepID=A0A931DXD7_9CORY|nr:hypothetical protein [Corynebacterium aquatimens]WJY65417.1 hypothetical protein CAQUA_03515 [Corynebacterium aquatimens]